jgi:hypothetical protein
VAPAMCPAFCATAAPLPSTDGGRQEEATDECAQTLLLGGRFRGVLGGLRGVPGVPYRLCLRAQDQPKAAAGRTPVALPLEARAGFYGRG